MLHLNGVCVRRLVADSEDIIHENFILLQGFSRGYVANENCKQVCGTHAKLLRQIYDAFFYLRQVEPTREHRWELPGKLREPLEFSLYSIFCITYTIMNKYDTGEPVNIHIQSLINIIQENNW